MLFVGAQASKEQRWYDAERLVIGLSCRHASNGTQKSAGIKGKMPLLSTSYEE